jgi:capsular exopolysaccharide synthesis family protein
MVNESGANAVANTVSLADAETGPLRRSTFEHGDHWADGGEPVRNAVSTLIKHWRLIAACTAVAIAIALVVTLLMKPTYTARATFEVQSDAPPVTTTDGSEQGRPDGAFLQTQLALLNSQALSNLVVERLKLDKNAAFMGDDDEVSGPAAAGTEVRRKQIAASKVRAGLATQVLENSSVIEVSFSGEDPRLAADISNAVVEQFFLSSVERRFAASNYVRDFLGQRLAQLKGKLESSERALIGYAGENGILSIPTQNGGEAGGSQSLETVGLPALIERVAQARAQRIVAEQNWRMASSRNGYNLPAMQDNPQVGTLTQELAKLEAEYEEKSKTFKPGYGPMEELHSRIQQTEAQIARLRDQNISALHASFDLAVQQEQALESQLRETRGSVFETQNRGVGYATLQREVQTNRALYDALLQRFKEIGISNGGSNRFAIVDRALPPRAPVSPNLPINLLIAIVAGLGIGMGVAFARDAIVERVSTPNDVAQKLRLPLLGITPMVADDLDGQLREQKSAVHEAYFSIETALRLASPNGMPKSILVVSTDVGEGKSTTSLGLANSLSERGVRTLLIDADMRRPGLHKRVGIANAKGLSAVLSGEANASEAIVRPSTYDFDVLPAGPLTHNPAQMLATQFARVLTDLGKEYDVIVVDSAPILGLADAPILANLTEGVVYVVEAGRNRPAAIRTAIQRLSNSNALLYGVVMTKIGARASGYDYAYASYHYDYGSES